MDQAKHARTPMATNEKLNLDKDAKTVNEKNLSWNDHPDIMFSVCLYARFQALCKESHLMSFNRIFRYLAATKNLGLLYPRLGDFPLVKYTDANYEGHMKGIRWIERAHLVPVNFLDTVQFLGTVKILYLFQWQKRNMLLHVHVAHNLIVDNSTNL